MSDYSELLNAMAKFSDSKLANKIYDDHLKIIAGPISKALATIIEIPNSTILNPVDFFNEKRRLTKEANLKRYKEKLEKFNKDEIVEVPSEIAVPIIEKFSYVSNEELCEMYTNLLVKASIGNECQKAHPGYVKIIERMAPDEALLLKYIFERGGLPILTLSDFIEEIPERENYIQEEIIVNREPKRETYQIVRIERNLKLYLDNLLSLGIIERKSEVYTRFSEESEKIYNFYKNHRPPNLNEKQEDVYTTLRRKDEMYDITNLGQSFTEACLLESAP